MLKILYLYFFDIQAYDSSICSVIQIYNLLIFSASFIEIVSQFFIYLSICLKKFYGYLDLLKICKQTYLIHLFIAFRYVFLQNILSDTIKPINIKNYLEQLQILLYKKSPQIILYLLSKLKNPPKQFSNTQPNCSLNSNNITKIIQNIKWQYIYSIIYKYCRLQKIMQSSKKQSTMQTTQKVDIQQLISQIIHLFDSLFNMRLIDKISRPITSPQRLQIVSEYKLKFNELHQKLDNLLKITTQTNPISKTKYNDKNQQKSTKVHKPIDLKNQIRKIQNKYIQLFRDGSFKYYQRVAKLHGLPDNMLLMDITYWANQILNFNAPKRPCC